MSVAPFLSKNYLKKDIHKNAPILSDGQYNFAISQ